MNKLLRRLRKWARVRTAFAAWLAGIGEAGAL